MSETRDYLSCAETAKLLRQALKARFPGQKFSVRSDTYAGGASIDVRWTDGPTDPEVDEVAQLYRGATFDGMIDLKSHHSSLLAGPDGEVREVHFGADFVFTNRSLSPEFTATYEPGIRKHGRSDGQNCEGCCNWIPEGDCWIAHRVRFGRPDVAFCCSIECAARLEARSNVTPRPAVQLGDTVEGIGKVELPKPLTIAHAWSQVQEHRTYLVGIDGRQVSYYATEVRQPYVA